MHVHKGTVKFTTHFKEFPCSPVVTFPSFGSEGHGVQPLTGCSGFFFFFIFLLDFIENFSYDLFFYFLLKKFTCEKTF